MKLNFVLPTEVESFEKIHYIELDEATAKKVVILNNSMSNTVSCLYLFSIIFYCMLEHPLLRPKNYKKIHSYLDEKEILDKMQELE